MQRNVSMYLCIYVATYLCIYVSIFLYLCIYVSMYLYSDVHADGLVHNTNIIRDMRERPKSHVHIHILLCLLTVLNHSSFL